MADKKHINKEASAGIALIAAGVGSAAASFDKVATVIKSSTEAVTGTVTPFGWSVSNYGITINELSYNKADTQWSLNVLKNGQFLEKVSMGLNQNLLVPINSYTSANFTFSPDGPNALKYTMTEIIQQHTVMAYPWWHSEALIGGVAAAVAGAVILVIGIRRLKKYNSMLRKEEEAKTE
ncbi:MAG: hypothetical protein QW814_02605 [Methanothrix sp.]